MTDTNNLIKNVATDIMSLTIMWGLINNPCINYNYYIDFNIGTFNSRCNFNTSYLTLIGIGTSTYILMKYV